MALTHLKSTGLICYRMSLNLGSSEVCFVIRPGLWIWGKNTTEEKCPSHLTWGTHVNMIFDDANLDHLVQVVSGRFLHAEFLFSPFHILFVRNESLSSAHTQGQEN